MVHNILFIYIYIYSAFVGLYNKLYKAHGTYIKIHVLNFIIFISELGLLHICYILSLRQLYYIQSMLSNCWVKMCAP